METIKIREEMEALWMESFGDSQKYVETVFNAYFDPHLIEYEKSGENIVSALLGVPYEFKKNEDSALSLRGLYLCGLSTKIENRSKGIMSKLLERINIKAKKEGFDFTFLIPSNEGIRKFYRDRDYVDNSYYIEENYVKHHKFRNQAGRIIIPEEMAEGCERGPILEFLDKHEIKEEAHYPDNFENIKIKHSIKDWETVINEAFLSKEKIILLKECGVLTGVCFIEHLKEGLKIKKMILQNAEDKEDALGAIQKLAPENSIFLKRGLQPEDFLNIKQVWEPFYAQNNVDGNGYQDISEKEEPFSVLRNAKSFGMCRIFDPIEFLKKIYKDKSFSLEGYSKEELNEIVLQRPMGREDSISTILNLPTINLEMSLMLE